MKKIAHLATGLLLVSLALTAHAQTTPPATKPAPPTPGVNAKAAIPKSSKVASTADQQDAHQLGQKFIHHSHEDVRPSPISVKPKKIE
jgi:hypothetical protein